MSDRVTIFPSARHVAVTLARRLATKISDTPALVLGLPTGRTPLVIYEELIRLVRDERIDISRLRTFNLDEFLGLPPGHPGSYRTYMEERVFGPLQVAHDQIGFLDGSTEDIPGECERYEAAIDVAGGIDVQVLGMGVNGHIGFNEPAESLAARTHRVTLTPETRRANAYLFDGDVASVPSEALTVGIGTILRARSVVVVATGRAKAPSVARMIEGPLTTWLPASVLQLHANVEVMIDEAAADRLRRPARVYSARGGI